MVFCIWVSQVVYILNSCHFYPMQKMEFIFLNHYLFSDSWKQQCQVCFYLLEAQLFQQYYLHALDLVYRSIYENLLSLISNQLIILLECFVVSLLQQALVQEQNLILLSNLIARFIKLHQIEYYLTLQFLLALLAYQLTVNSCLVYPCLQTSVSINFCHLCSHHLQTSPNFSMLRSYHLVLIMTLRPFIHILDCHLNLNFSHFMMSSILMSHEYQSIWMVNYLMPKS